MLAYIPADVSDIDAEEKRTVLVAARKNAVVEVFRILTVNRNDREIAAVTASAVFFGSRFRLRRVSFGLYVFRK